MLVEQKISPIMMNSLIQVYKEREGKLPPEISALFYKFKNFYVDRIVDEYFGDSYRDTEDVSRWLFEMGVEVPHINQFINLLHQMQLSHTTAQGVVQIPSVMSVW